MDSAPRTKLAATAITALLIVAACTKSESSSSTSSTTADKTPTTAAPGGGSSSAPGSTSTRTNPTYGPTDTTINAAPNSTFSIRLESNPSTGYTWTFTSQSDIVRLVDQRTEAPDTAKVGAPGAQVFTFEAAAAGTTSLAFTYARAAPSPDDKTITYVVNVS